MKRGVGTFLLFGLFSTFIYGCSKSNGQSYEEPTMLKDGAVKLPQRMDASVEVTQPKEMDVTFETSLLGKVDFDPNLVSSVFSLTEGVATKIFVNQGNVVRKGQPLAEVYSTGYASALSDFQKAKSQLATSRNSYQRAQELAESSIVSQKDFQQATNDFQQAQADYDRALKTLELLGGDEHSEGATYEITSPIDGIVLERTAQLGSAVRSDASQALFVVGNTKHVWVQLDVYQDELRKVAVGDSVQLTFDESVPPLITTIKYLSPVIDQTTLTAKARCELQNTNGSLKPAMFGTAKVFHRGHAGMFIPSSSEIFGSDGNPYVFLKIGNGTYERRRITSGQSTNNMVEVITGLRPDDWIVFNVPLLIDSELELAEQ
jgi:cobalt-zinc-cadmium efflux system membrane fusion protein